MVQNQLLQGAIAKEVTRPLRSEKNGLVPISQLPPELLARIFQFVADDKSRESEPLKRITFSHVSYHWRDVALSTPSLWRVISLGFPDCLTVMLQRSKMADLILYAGPGLKTSNYTQIFQLTLSHMERVCEITICFCRRGSQAIGHIHEMLSRFPKSAPRLRSLSITSSDADSKYTMSLPKGFPLSETPRLRQLVLARCNFLDWDSKLLTGLTSLSVEYIARNNHPSARQVLNALRRMPALSNLVLRHMSLFFTSDSNIPREGPVHLPELKNLHLAGRLNDISFILSHVVINPSASIELDSFDKRDRSAPPDIPNFISSFSLFCNTYESRPVDLDLETSSYEADSLDLCLATYNTEPFDGNYHRRTTRPQFSLRLYMKILDDDDEHNAGSILQKILSMIRPMSLRGLNWYNSDHGITPSLVVDTFGHLPNLERIYVEETFRGPFIDALIHKPDDYNSSPAAWSYVAFPQLQKLELSGRRIEGEEIRALQDCLIERCERNAPIQALTIQPGVDVAKEDVALLREIVVDFKVK